MAITWTKEWEASDDGTILSGLDLKNIQDDITSGSAGDATSIHSVPIVAPTAAEDGQVLFYNNSAPSFDYFDTDTIIPTGVILLWSGAISAIPTNWVLCDGTAGTPDLTDRFVIHADADAAGTNDVGDTGGSRTISTGNLPAHSHTYTRSTGTGPSIADGVSERAWRDSAATTPATSSTGSGTDYLPKFYALAYIMKT